MRPLLDWWRRRPRLRLLVLAVSDRCDQRCAHCQIWMGARAPGTLLTRAERLRVVEEALASGARAALITGGEPLIAPDLWPVAERLRAGGARLLLATGGMRLQAVAGRVGGLFHEVYVSLDGASAVTHDALRGVAAFARVARGVAALREAAPHVLRVARCTLHARNLHEVDTVVDEARRMGFHHVSFLPLDASSDAFGGLPAARLRLVPTPAQVARFEATIDRLEGDGLLRDGFVLEPAAKLRRLAAHLRASGGAGAFDRPACDAPWWSLVVEADGIVRPCFFHEPVGDARAGLRHLRASRAYRDALDRIREPNQTCARCVCPKKAGRGLRESLRA